MKIAVYGSLKRGKYNHAILSDQKFLGDTTVIGTLYSVGAYPALVDEGDNVYPAEIYEVSPEVYSAIRGMELGAGYVEKVVDGNIVYYAGEYLAQRCKNNLKVIESY